MKLSLFAYCLFAVLICSVNLAGAQNGSLPRPPAGIVIDGDLHEWGDSLKHYNPELMLGYDLANDRDNIYIAIRISDPSEQARVLRNGFTVGINTTGKKKDTYSITFPVGGNESALQQATQQLDNDNAPQDHDEMMRAKLTKLRNIKVTGFKDVESEVITTANTYGFKTAMSYDEKGYLLYEAAVPLKFFDLSDAGKAGWAFNFKVNGFKQTRTDVDSGGMQGGGMGRGGMGGGGRGGMGGGRGGMGGGRGGMNRSGGTLGSNNEMSKTVDFWDKFPVKP